MNSESHLGLNVIILGAISFLFFSIFDWNILNLNLIHLFITVYILSNIADIDNSNSKISKTFFIFYIMLFIFGILNIFGTKILVGIFQILVALLLGYYHSIIAEDSYNHRKFPHTFTFGFFVSIILLVFTSFPIFIIGILCFILHIIEDNHIQGAINKDKKFWNNLWKRVFSKHL